jgi:hypothetical protein
MGVKDYFCHGEILRSAMGRKLDYGRIFGWGITISATISISLYHRAAKNHFGCRCFNWGSSKYQISKNFNW